MYPLQTEWWSLCTVTLLKWLVIIRLPSVIMNNIADIICESLIIYKLQGDLSKKSCMSHIFAPPWSQWRSPSHRSARDIRHLPPRTQVTKTVGWPLTNTKKSHERSMEWKQRYENNLIASAQRHSKGTYHAADSELSNVHLIRIRESHLLRASAIGIVVRRFCFLLHGANIELKERA